MTFKLFDKPEDATNLLKINHPRLVRLGKYEVCLVRTTEKLIAFKNECPHRGHGLHHGRVNFRGEMVCALHGYVFHLPSGEEMHHRCSSLVFLKVSEKEDGIYLSLP